MDLYLEPGSLSEDTLVVYSALFETEFATLAGRLGVEPPPTRVRMKFAQPQPSVAGLCPARGYSQAGRTRFFVVVWADDETSPEQVLGVASHELAHYLTSVRFGPSSDELLREGGATWLGRDSWTRWHGWTSLDTAVLDWVQEGSYTPLVQDSGRPMGTDTIAQCWSRRNALYTERASFVGYLIDRYGIDAFATLWGSSQQSFVIAGTGPRAREQPTPSSTDGSDFVLPRPDYEGVFGESFEAIEQQWLASLKNRVD